MTRPDLGCFSEHSNGHAMAIRDQKEIKKLFSLDNYRLYQGRAGLGAVDALYRV